MMLLTELEPLLSTIHEQTEKLIAAIKQLVRASALKKSDFSSRGLPSSIKILLEKKFQSLVPAVKQLLEVIKKNEQDRRLQEQPFGISVAKNKGRVRQDSKRQR